MFGADPGIAATVIMLNTLDAVEECDATDLS